MSEIEFASVGLEVESREPLDLLVTAFGEDVLVTYNGPARGRFLAAFELATGYGGGDAESTIAHFCLLIERLPPAARSLWGRCMIRTFDIGFNSGDRPSHFRAVIHPQTVQRVAALNGSVIVTIYPPWPDDVVMPRGAEGEEG